MDKIKDIDILAYPAQDKAVLSPNSEDGRSFVEKLSVKELNGDLVNSTINDIKENNLSYSFRLGS